MRWRFVLLLGGVVLACLVSARLGFWQLSRWREKQAVGEARTRALEAPPHLLDGSERGEDIAGQVVELAGEFDGSRQVLLPGPMRDETPGVEVLTALRRERGAAVLVNRGWLAAGGGDSVRPQDFPEPGRRRVRGVAEPMTSRGDVPRLVRADSATLIWARRASVSALKPLFDYPLASFTVRELPGVGVPPRPARSAPPPVEAGTHLSYAIQWFSIAAVLLGGSVALAFSRLRRT